MNLYSEPSHLAPLAQQLEASKQYQVLRKLELSAMQYAGPLPLPPDWTRVLVLDTETTDLTPACELIELGLLLVAIDPHGVCHGVMDSYNGLQEPKNPISEEATSVHGLTLADVQGQALDTGRVAALLDAADLVLAHNAEFDRPVVERSLPQFANKPWVCSFRDVGWKGLGQRRANLEALASTAGFFYGAHRAMDDCAAVTAILSHAYEGHPSVWLQVLAAVTRQDYVLWAVHSPFHTKDLLKGRGYRWQGDAGGPYKAWYRGVPESELTQELAWLKEQVYQREFSIPAAKTCALTRWSGREGQWTTVRPDAPQ